MPFDNPLEEYKLYEHVISRRIRQSGAEKRTSAIKQQSGHDFTPKQKYFMNMLSLGLQHAFYVSKELFDNKYKDLAWEVVKGAVIVGGATLAAKGITSAVSDSRVMNNVITFTTAALTGIYSINSINNLVQAQAHAKRILQFLESNNVEGVPTFITIISCELCIQYRFFIEMLQKSEGGIDELVKFFIQKILQLASEITDLETQARADKVADKKEIDDWKLIHIERNLTKDDNIPKTKLFVDGVDETVDLEWNLYELLKHAPVLVSTYLDRQNAYEFTFYLYLSTHEKKIRIRKVGGDFFPSFSREHVEGSHKYPPRVMYLHDTANDQKGYISYQNKNGYELLKPQCYTPGPNCDKAGWQFINWVDFYHKIRLLKRNANIENFLESVEAFSRIKQQLESTECATNSAWYDLFVEIETLRNVFHSVVKPIYPKVLSSLSDKESKKKCNDVFYKFKDIFDKLSSLYKNDLYLISLKSSLNNYPKFFHIKNELTSSAVPVNINNCFDNLSFKLEEANKLERMLDTFEM